MTNHWADIANASSVIVWGANPTENHPACMAHVNRARYPKQFFASTDPRSNKPGAKLIVIDPRKNRTAAQADLYVRIRPGTDIAFGNGLTRYIIDRMQTPGALYSDGSAIDPTIQSEFFAYLNQTGNGTFFTDGASGSASTSSAPVPGNSKYTDARFLVNAGGDDYQRQRVVASTGAYTSGSPSSTTISDFPIKAASVTGDPNTVFNKMWGTVNPYTPSVVAGICGCTEAELKAVGDEFIRNSRHASTPEGPQTFTRTFRLSGTGAEPLWAYNVASGSIVVQNEAGTVTYPAAAYTLTPGASRRALGTIASTGLAVASGGIANPSRVKVTYTGTTDQAPQVGYKATTVLYAMGITQHTYGSQNIKMFANLQTILGNMGRAGGGINALRGIHNVQGSTDMGLLYGNIPGYSANPSTQVAAIPDTTGNPFGKYMDALWGTPLSGTGNKAKMDQSYDDAYNTAAMALQQRGFFNMTHKWFGNYAVAVSGSTSAANLRKWTDASYSLWPKGNGNNHIKMFRDMVAGTCKAAVVWGQNPAVTEPNQGKVREALAKVPLLVCVDMFETETAAVARDAGTVTYLLPAASHVEKAGSATNSGRTLQWRYKAADPLGNSKDDTELLLRFAKALDGQQAFKHISDVWTAQGITWDTSVYKMLYQAPYGGFTGAAGTFATLSGPGEYVTVRNLVSDTLALKTTPVTMTTLDPGTVHTNVTLKGSEWVTEQIFSEWAGDLGVGGTIWIYTEGYDPANKSTDSGLAAGKPRITGMYAKWDLANRAKSRDRSDPYGVLQFSKWGYCWLVNRRVIYNNGEVVGDQNDFFMGPDSCVRLFAPKYKALTTLYSGVYNYSRWYRTSQSPTNHALFDVPINAAGVSSPPPPAHVAPALPGRFPVHTEPYESPRPDLVASYGYNSSEGTVNSGGTRNLLYAGTKTMADFPDGKFPLVLTTVRCVEHFQGGPITRNNWWNVEAEPEPWIEINAVDARTYDIKDGDHVKVVTARTEDLVDDKMPLYGDGFVARVGVGLQSNQRVGQGVVAIPWHWGDKGLSTGSRANDLTIDAMDANTTIPEFKACMCRIEKIPTP